MQFDGSAEAYQWPAPPSARARAVRRLRWLRDIRGWSRIVNLLVGEENAAFTVENEGVYFSGNLRSHIDRQIYLLGGYEHWQIEQFINLIPAEQRRVVLDVGSNVGNHSIAFAQAFECVHAFEPNPLLWDQFDYNVGINLLDHRVALHRMGLGEQDEELTLNIPQDANLCQGTFVPDGQGDKRLVPAARCLIRQGDHYVAELRIPEVNAIKIDVEGYEFHVLRGLQAVIARDRPVIWYKCNAARNRGAQGPINNCTELARLIPYAFNLYKMDRRTLSLVSPDDLFCDGDYILVPDVA